VGLLLIAELCTIGQAHVCRPANDLLFEGRDLTKKSVIACSFMAFFYKRTAFTFTLFVFFFLTFALCKYPHLVQVISKVIIR